MSSERPAVPQGFPRMKETEARALLREVILATAQLLRANDLDASIQDALGRVAQTIGADAAALFEYPRRDAQRDNGTAPTDAASPDAASAESSPAGFSSTESPSERRDRESPVRLYTWSPAAAPSADPSADMPGNDDSLAAGGEAASFSGGPGSATDPVSTFTMTVPITVQGQPWGTLRFDTSDGRTEWTQKRISILQLMAQNFGEAIRRSRFEETQADRESLPDIVMRVVDHAVATGQLQGGVMVVQFDGTVLYQNESLVDLSGRTRVGLNRSGGLLPHLRPVSVRSAVRKALQNGEEMDAEVSIGAKDSVSLHLQLTPITGSDDEPICTICWFQSLATETAELSNERQNLSLRRRVRAERALVDASRLLVASDACDFDQLLEIVGEATEARYAYLVIITPDDVVGTPKEDSYAEVTRAPIHLDTYSQHEWFSSSASRHTQELEEGGPTFAVPILSADDQLFGYMGVEYEVGSSPYRDEDARVLSVLGDMLCTYLRRQLSEEALRRSEQRYRYFVDTIDEAIWRVDLKTPIPPDRETDAQVEHVLEHGIISEANAAMARLFEVESKSELIGLPVSRLLDVVSLEFLYNLAQAGFELRQHEYVVSREGERERYFMMNTVGVDEGNGIQGIWGSGTEVTDRVVLERRMVEALERQQQRFGHNLHDRVSQQLAGTRMLAQNLSVRYFEDDPKGQREVEKIISYVQEAAQHVSDLQRGVMPVQVDRDGLAQGLRELASRIERLPNVDCTYEHDGHTDISHQQVKLQLYRIAQEATRNAVAHGQPSRVHIELVGEDEAIILRVEDDGQGFDLARMDDPTASTLGIHSMRYRAHTIGASLNIDAAEGEGARIEVRLPRETLRRKMEE